MFFCDEVHSVVRFRQPPPRPPRKATPSLCSFAYRHKSRFNVFLIAKAIQDAQSDLEQGISSYPFEALPVGLGGVLGIQRTSSIPAEVFGLTRWLLKLLRGPATVLLKLECPAEVCLGHTIWPYPFFDAAGEEYVDAIEDLLLAPIWYSSLVWN
jgi:hypothetical protein